MAIRLFTDCPPFILPPYYNNESFKKHHKNICMEHYNHLPCNNYNGSFAFRPDDVRLSNKQDA